MSRSRSEIVNDWSRNYVACLSPESKLGSLRGAARDNVLSDVLKKLKIFTPIDLFEQLHQGELIVNDEHQNGQSRAEVSEFSDCPAGRETA